MVSVLCDDGSEREVRAIKGRGELTEEVLDRMAADAERGLDVTRLRRRPGRPSMGEGPAETLPVRLDPALRKAVDDRATADRTSASEVVREASRRFLRVS